MLLDRRKVKFWQKIIFGFMAFLMAAFLVVGYSGVLNGCTWFNSAQQDVDPDARPADHQVPDRRPRPTPRTSRPGSASPRRTSRGRPTQAQGSRGADGGSHRARPRPTPRPTSCSPSRRAPPSRSSGWTCSPASPASTASSATPRRPRSVYGDITALTPQERRGLLQPGRGRSTAGDTTTAMLAFTRFLELDPEVAGRRGGQGLDQPRTRRRRRRLPLHRRPSKETVHERHVQRLQ